MIIKRKPNQKWKSSFLIGSSKVELSVSMINKSNENCILELTKDKLQQPVKIIVKNLSNVNDLFNIAQRNGLTKIFISISQSSKQF